MTSRPPSSRPSPAGRSGTAAGSGSEALPMGSRELQRYARHIVLREIGGPGQNRLRRSRVFVAGAGGLGSPVLEYLAAAGVGSMTVADHDVVGLSNLQRQVLFDEGQIGLPKVEAARARLARLNPDVRVRPLEVRLDKDNCTDLVRGHDLVLDGTDTFDARHVINEAAVATGIPLVSGAISQWEGQLSVFDPADGTPCYACVFPEKPAEGLAPTCAEAGVVGALPGVLGAMMAAEAIKLITGAGSVLKGEMLIYDALNSESRKIRLMRHGDCAVCGDRVIRAGLTCGM